MKKLILSVGVIFLTSSMALTTTAFGEENSFKQRPIVEKPICVIDLISGTDIYELKFKNKKGKTLVRVASSTRYDVVNALLSYVNSGACSYYSIKDFCK